jgi:hypothetical protein
VWTAADVPPGSTCVRADPMTDARAHKRSIECGPAGPDRDALATDFHHTHKLAGVPPGSILRPRH